MLIKKAPLRALFGLWIFHGSDLHETERLGCVVLDDLYEVLTVGQVLTGDRQDARGAFGGCLLHDAAHGVIDEDHALLAAEAGQPEFGCQGVA